MITQTRQDLRHGQQVLVLFGWGVTVDSGSALAEDWLGRTFKSLPFLMCGSSILLCADVEKILQRNLKALQERSAVDRVLRGKDANRG
jgi:hypothetical protein